MLEKHLLTVLKEIFKNEYLCYYSLTFSWAGGLSVNVVIDKLKPDVLVTITSGDGIDEEYSNVVQQALIEKLSRMRSYGLRLSPAIIHNALQEESVDDDG